VEEYQRLLAQVEVGMGGEAEKRGVEEASGWIKGSCKPQMGLSG
jgi:hypothetical protein